MTEITYVEMLWKSVQVLYKCETPVDHYPYYSGDLGTRGHLSFFMFSITPNKEGYEEDFSIVFYMSPFGEVGRPA